MADSAHIKNINIDKQHIIQEINNLDINNLDYEILKNLKKCIDKFNKNCKKTNKIKPKNNIDKTTNKYKILLKYVNGILKNMNKDEIQDLTDFKDIDRIYIIQVDNKQLLDSLAPTLFKYFNKDKCGYYRKTKNIALNVLRGMCKEIGLQLINKKVTKSESHATFGTHYLYSIQ